MNRLLRDTQPPDGRHRLGAPSAVLDEPTRQLIDQARQEGYEHGHRDGAAEAGAAADERTRQLTGAVNAATDTIRQLLDQQAAAQADRIVDLARTVTQTLTGQELTAGGQQLLDRIRDAARQLDHGPFTLTVSPADYDAVTAAPLPADLTVTADLGLTPGDARIDGPWSHADLTVQTIVDQLIEQQR